MKVQNMTSSRGNDVPNQFIINNTESHYAGGELVERDTETFQSYKSIIAKKYRVCDRMIVELDSYYWDYSVTTGKYRNQFLGESKKETQSKIDSGEYILTNLN